MLKPLANQHMSSQNEVSLRFLIKKIKKANVSVEVGRARLLETTPEEIEELLSIEPKKHL